LSQNFLNLQISAGEGQKRATAMEKEKSPNRDSEDVAKDPPDHIRTCLCK